MLPGSILHSSNYQTVTEADFVVLVCESFFFGGGGGDGGTSHTHPCGLLYTDKVSSWTFLFLPLHRKLLPLRPLKKSKHTDAFCLKFS